MGDFKQPKEVSDNRTVEVPNEQLSEEDIGITQYISDHEGFHGIVKYRFSDFQVSEISLQGEVAKLTDMSVPIPPKPEEIMEDEDLLFNKYNLEILPMEMWDKINKMVVDNNYNDLIQIDVTDKTKEGRTSIHNAVSNAFGSTVVGSTVTQGDKKYVQFKRYKRGDRIDKRVKWAWPGEYVYFVVHKTNCDSMEAASRIAESLRSHIKPQMISFAGTKDRRAVTSQWFCLRKVEPKKLLEASKTLRNIHIGNFTFHNEVLKLGMLKGNLFRVAIRNISASEDLISRACNSIKENGFINYYGQQRFGSRKSTPTYMVGRYLLKGDFEAAIECVLSSQEGRAAQAWPGNNTHGARGPRRSTPTCRWQRYCSLFPRSSPEGRMLAALLARPADHYGAFNAVPRNMRLLYLNSYQSLVWNRCVSERIKRFGLGPAVGDLVLAQPDELKDETLDNTSDTETEEPSTKTDKKETKSQKNNESKQVEVSVLTEEDISSGRYTIFDVVMPLPGYRVQYPPNMVDYYTSLLAEDGLTLKLNKNKHQSYTLAGTYRAAARRPRRVAWQLAAYCDPKGSLIASDLDDIHGLAPAGLHAEGQYRALLLTFSLPSSSYATMLLRELLKADTSSHAQALNNHYYKEPTQNKETIDKEAVENTNKETIENINKRPNESEQEGVKKLKVD